MMQANLGRSEMLQNNYSVIAATRLFVWPLKYFGKNLERFKKRQNKN